ncbi:MAG: DUF3617 domain-containing protein [Leptospirillia bacterium]
MDTAPHLGKADARKPGIFESFRGVFPYLITLFLILGFVRISGAEPSPHFKAGEWKIDADMTLKSSSPGIPGMPARKSSFFECLSAHHLVPDQKARMPKGCSLNRQLQGNTLTLTIRCSSSVTRGSYTYSGTTFRGESVTTMRGGLPMIMETRFSGHYVGPCRKSGQ